MNLLQASLDELHSMAEQVARSELPAVSQALLRAMQVASDPTMVLPTAASETASEAAGGSAERELADDADDAPLEIPQPDRLGDLARDLIEGKAPDKPEPLPEIP